MNRTAIPLIALRELNRIGKSVDGLGGTRPQHPSAREPVATAPSVRAPVETELSLETLQKLFGVRDPAEAHLNEKQRRFMVAPREIVANHLSNTITKNNTTIIPEHCIPNGRFYANALVVHPITIRFLIACRLSVVSNSVL